MKRVLITGGLGYIGSHTAVELLKRGYEVDIIDNYINSSSEILERIQKLSGKKARFKYADLTALHQIENYFHHSAPDYVIHFAALKAVEESVEDPLAYYHNNVTGLINLLKAAKWGKGLTKKFIFSSSCTVYDPSFQHVNENTPIAKTPASPYGATKIMCEQILTDWSKQSGVSVDLLRYFNPVGADESGELGEVQMVKRNLFPRMMDAILKDLPVTIYGRNYETPDGTCVRDYIHVSDLAEGHVKSLEKDSQGVNIYNLGTGTGTSVLEIVNACSSIMGREVKIEWLDRRPGDIPAIWADTTYAEKELGWVATRNVLDMVRTAWAWEETINGKRYDQPENRFTNKDV